MEEQTILAILEIGAHLSLWEQMHTLQAELYTNLAPESSGGCCTSPIKCTWMAVSLMVPLTTCLGSTSWQLQE